VFNFVMEDAMEVDYDLYLTFVRLNRGASCVSPTDRFFSPGKFAVLQCACQ
jgi:hypothetical protein